MDRTAVPVAKKQKKPKKPKLTLDKRYGERLTAGPAQDDLAFARACQLHQGGKLDDAVQAYQRAIQLNPQRGDAWRNLGALLRRRGAMEEGRHCTEQALKLNPNDPSLWGNYGNVLRDLGLADESLKAFGEGLRLQPGNLALLQGQAITLSKQGRQGDVVQLLSPWLDEPVPPAGSNAIAELLLELGNAHHSLDNRELALQCWRRGALSAEGEKRLLIGLNTAQVLCEQQRFKEAGSVCEELRPLFPQEAKLAYAEAMVAKGLGLVDKAIELFDRALALQENYPICLNSYGLLLREIGRTHQARNCFELALKFDPHFGAAMNNLGSVLKDVARYEEALLWLRKGAEAMADSPAAHSNVLFTLVGYELESAEACFEEARRYAKKVSTSPFLRAADLIPDPDPQRILRIGLLSPDFCRHAVSYFIEPLLEQWDRKQLHVTLYSCGDQHDDYTERLQRKGDQWRDLRGQSDETAIAQIQRDEIDILIDLAGHTAGNRLPVMAAKPAPIQATYLGYYGTTGLEQVDYWLTDSVLHPLEKERADPATEQRWRLERCYVAYRPLPEAPAVSPPPCMKNGYVSFGSFNQSRKVTRETAKHWLAALQAVPGSHLLLKSKNLGEKTEQQRVRQLFAHLGLEEERLELMGHSPSVADHLATYSLVDIALDTYPYTGCTTTADALWMGVPVLTIAGRSMVSRQAAAILAGAGCGQWICQDVEELARKAKSLSDDRDELTTTRHSLRQRVAASELLNHQHLARCTEQAFRKWWTCWLNQQGWIQVTGRIENRWRFDPEAKQSRMSMGNTDRIKIPLWIGAMPNQERKRWNRNGYTIVSFAMLPCWQGPIALFEQQRRGQKMLLECAQLTPEAATMQLQRWQRVYPQLVWTVVN